MEINKLQERVNQLQTEINTASPEQQQVILAELVDIMSQLEINLTNIKIEENEE